MGLCAFGIKKPVGISPAGLACVLLAWGVPQDRIPKLIAVFVGALLLCPTLGAGRTSLVTWGQTNVPPGLTNVVAISAYGSDGNIHILALKADGTVVGWGRNTNVPAGLSNVMAISVGIDHSLALHSNGTVTAWVAAVRTWPDYGQAIVPAGLTNVIAVAAGGLHSLALRSDRSVVGWGRNVSGEASPPPWAKGVKSISAGLYHSLALSSNNTPIGWGENTYLQLKFPAAATNITKLVSGWNHCLAIESDGSLIAWGRNAAGEATVPPNLTNVVDAAGGHLQSLAITEDGRVVAFGSGAFGSGVVPANLSNVISVASAWGVSAAITHTPFITSQPRGQTVLAGSDVDFSATATGVPPLTYQWFHNGRSLDGETNLLLALRNVQSEQHGVYKLVVSNIDGTISSRDAVLTVNGAPVISPAIVRSVLPGEQAVLNATVSGATPFSYQWRFNGLTIAGATNSTLIVTNAQFENQGEYSVTASNSFGTTTGLVAFLEVRPTVSINDVVVPEGNAGTNYARFTVSLSWSSTQTVHVTYYTLNGTAIAGSDYVQSSGSIAVPPGSTNELISIPLLSDIALEADETFSINVTSANNTVTRAQGIGRIANDDTFPMIFPVYGVLSEGVGTNVMVFTLALTAPFTNNVSVDLTTADGTANAGLDYIATSQRVIFPTGSVSQTFSVPILGDWLKESNEIFYVNLSNVTNASLAQTQTSGTIYNDDSLTVPAGFSVSLVGQDLVLPTTMQFAPDGRLFVCEQEGKVWIFKNGTRLSAPFLSINVTTEDYSEAGLLGLAFDPNFSVNRYVYVYYTSAVPYTHNRVSRFTANGDIAVAGSERVLFEMDGVPGAPLHNGGAIHFGADGKLYIGVGDNHFSFNSQSVENLLGKLLRINRDGSIPADNPFFDVATENNRAIWALGLRNPYEFAVHPVNGRIFVNDVGEDTWEEINDGVAGANYGWPGYEGLAADLDFRNPLFAYGHGMTGTNGCSITGGTFYSPATNQFPHELKDNYLFTDYCGGWIHRLAIANGVTRFGFISGLTNPITLRVSADGSLYCLSRGRETAAGMIHKFTYTLPLPGEIRSMARSPGGAVILQIKAGATGVDVIQVSANLYDWITIATNATTPSVGYSFTDPRSSGSSRRFYRILGPSN